MEGRELRLEAGTDVEGRAAHEGEDGTLGREGFGDAGADDAGGTDDGAVFACQAECHIV